MREPYEAIDLSTPTTTTASAQSGATGVLIAAILLVAGAAYFVLCLVVPIFFVGVWVFPLLLILTLPGHYLVQPNEGLVVILFGRYKGTIAEPGWHWTWNPFTRMETRKISLRVHNFNTTKSKINDAEGNPIEIAAVVVWRVVNTEKAVFDVDDYQDYVEVQSETAIRHLGTQYPYDDFTGERTSLRADPDIVAETLHVELQSRLEAAGVEVIEARLTHLAYATEIAEAMLRRQQASAIVAARRTIVEGAVGVVEDALEMLAKSGTVELDEERKAAMVSNLLVVLTSDQPATPVINTGSLY